MCLYAAHLIFRVRKWEPPMVRKPFSVRVMIPCYKEDIETLEETVECAIEAAKAAMAKGQANAGAFEAYKRLSRLLHQHTSLGVALNCRVDIDIHHA